MSMDERVLAIPAAYFRQVGEFTGFLRVTPEYRKALLDLRQFAFHPRSMLETNPEWKQLIPYVVLRVGNQYFHYRRGKSGTEARLHAKRSIGIGGHISESDAQGEHDLYTNGMLRELHEEVRFTGDCRDEFLGFIYDPSTPVGTVHLGVVHLFTLNDTDVKANEASIADHGFESLENLHARREEFETWSQLVLQELRGN